MHLGKSEKDKIKMDKAKNMLYRLVARTLSLKEFEDWLYHDEYVLKHIIDDERILELLSIKLQARDAMYELEKFCFTYFM